MMLTIQQDQTGATGMGQTHGNKASAAMAQQVVTPTVQMAPHASTTSAFITVEGTQVTQELGAMANLTNLRVPMPQNGLHTALTSFTLVLAILIVWQIHRRHRMAAWKKLAVAQDYSSGQDDVNPHERKREPSAQPTLVNVNAMAASSAHERSVQDDEDTSQPQSASRTDFDNEATYIFMPHVERQIVGHLVRVTSETRFPAKLALLGAPSMSSGECEIAIGRHSKHNTVVIGDRSVSRKHAIIVQRGEQLFVRDNASTAGTLLNWKRLNMGDELLLCHQDILSLGEAVYELRMHPEETSGPLTLMPEFAREETELIDK